MSPAKAEALEQYDLRFAAEFTVAAGKLPRVGACRHLRILVAMKVQNLRPGRRAKTESRTPSAFEDPLWRSA
jgi:hypothetical protein